VSCFPDRLQVVDFPHIQREKLIPCDGNDVDPSQYSLGIRREWVLNKAHECSG
jgi:hypothetical protein